MQYTIQEWGGADDVFKRNAAYRYLSILMLFCLQIALLERLTELQFLSVVLGKRQTHESSKAESEVLILDNIVVSVIVPIYNVAPWLDDCLTSLERQTLKNIEVILVNDGSTDGSDAIAQRYADRNSNFTLVRRENGGLSAARNTGMDRARGEYLYFLDSDDYLADTALEELYMKASSENLDVLKFSAYTFYDGCNELSQTEYLYQKDYPTPCKGSDALSLFLHYNEYIPSCCLLFIKRNTVKNHCLRFYKGIVHEDNLFHFQLLALSERVAVWNQPLYYRRVREGSIMVNPNWAHRCHSWCAILTETEAFIREHPEINESVGGGYIKIFISQLFNCWSCLSPEDQRACENKMRLNEVKPIIKKYRYADRRDVWLYCLNPGLYQIYKRIASFVKMRLR